MIGVLLYAAHCLAADCDSGACRPAERPHPAVVRVVNAEAGCLSCGSGTLVEKDEQAGLVLTCAHLFRTGVGEVTVAFSGGPRYGARVVAVDEDWDMAALEIAAPAAAPVALAADPPRPGDALESCGYGRDGRYACNRGRALGYARTTATKTHETLELTGMAREGDSGGPVFNSRGELVAVLWGTDGRTVEATYCGRIRSFLAALLGRRSRPRIPPGIAPGVAPAPIDPRPKVQSPSPPSPSPPADRLDELRRRLEAHEGTLRERGEGLEKATALAGEIKRRIESVETAVGGENLRTLVREAATGIVVQGAPTLIERVLPAVLAALGWTGPPSIAVILAVRLMATIWKRRARKRDTSRKGSQEPQRRAGRRLNDDYAGQLAGVFALSGRSPLADATLGREYDEQLRQAETSSDATLARWAKSLRKRVADKFFRIHSSAPAPADPVEEAK